MESTGIGLPIMDPARYTKAAGGGAPPSHGEHRSVEPRKTSASAGKVIFLVCGAWLIGLGLYFIFLRPVLLPEDLRYIGFTVSGPGSATPGMVAWLHRVFTVMGGFMMGAGVLLIALMVNEFQSRKKGELTLLALSGACTVGTMSVTNFQLDSDFKWPLLMPALLWIAGLILYQRQR